MSFLRRHRPFTRHASTTAGAEDICCALRRLSRQGPNTKEGATQSRSVPDQRKTEKIGMTEVLTRFFVQPVARRDDGAHVPDGLIECISAEEAFEMAAKIARRRDTAHHRAFSRTGYPEWGFYQGPGDAREGRRPSTVHL